MRILVPIAGAWLVLSIALTAFREGPLPNMTGGFGEPSCHSCHFDNPLDAPGGMLSLGGVPSAYAAGGVYDLTVKLSRTGLTRGGFEISARFASGPQRGRQAGTWRTAGPRLQTVASKTDPLLLFVQHTTAGSATAAPGTATWTMTWTAPSPAPAPVQFNVAANATNDDASPLGDYIYLKAAVARPR